MALRSWHREWCVSQPMQTITVSCTGSPGVGWTIGPMASYCLHTATGISCAVFIASMEEEESVSLLRRSSEMHDNP